MDFFLFLFSEGDLIKATLASELQQCSCFCSTPADPILGRCRISNLEKHLEAVIAADWA